ncbi:MAG: AarF/ABC1/UbiB kinase family protein [Victivallales bacterium]|nr:AarF/ABC1/UbiB kinase family protein [Victivallales bacterium]
MGSLLVPIVKTYRYFANMNHMRRILTVLFKNGLGMFFGGLRDLVPRKYTESVHSDERQETLPVRIRKTLVELGPTFVKLGQMLSTRPDVIGAEYVAEFSKLQDEVPPFSFDEVKEIVEKELGRPLTEIFREFSEEPSAAASIAQGHRAVLQDGTVVFVKIQRPEIRKKILADIEVLGFLSRHVDEHFPNLRYLLLPRLVEQFRTSILEELDFNVERGNIKHFARQFANEKALVVPKVWDEFSTGQVLTMEWIDGISGNRFEELRQSGCDLVKLANDGAELALKQFFTYGFFHADPHPGNIFVLPGNRICYIDFGLCGRITDQERSLFCRMLMSVLERDERHVARMLLKLTVYEQEPDLDDLECALGEFIDRNFYGEIRDLDVPGALRQLYELCRQFRLSLKPHIYLMVRAMGLSDNLGRKLDPSFDLQAHLRPYVQATVLRQLDIMKSAHRHLEELVELRDNLAAAPGVLRSFFAQLMGGKLVLRHSLDDREEFLRLYLHAQNRRTVATCAAGTMVASALLMIAKIPPIWHGASVWGELGFLLTILMLAVLAFDILRVDK